MWSIIERAFIIKSDVSIAVIFIQLILFQLQ